MCSKSGYSIYVLCVPNRLVFSVDPNFDPNSNQASSHLWYECLLVEVNVRVYVLYSWYIAAFFVNSICINKSTGVCNDLLLLLPTMDAIQVVLVTCHRFADKVN